MAAFASAAKGAAPHLQWGQTATFQGDENIMGLSAQALKAGLDAIAAQTPRSAPRWNGWATRTAHPRARLCTMLRTIVGQQVSVAAAASMWRS
jgi:3-methyladenine DNA glycosylase/8-oxoguanine DNA glycosylase